MKILSICQFAVLLHVVGCSTPYGPTGFYGGYSETRLMPDVVRITFKGNNATSSEKAQDFALLRAAELCLQSGYRYFAILDEKNTVQTRSITTAGYSLSNGSAYGTPGGVNYYGSTTYVPGQTIPINTPETGIMVKFLKTKPSGVTAFDAAFLSKSLRDKYQIK